MNIMFKLKNWVVIALMLPLISACGEFQTKDEGSEKLSSMNTNLTVDAQMLAVPAVSCSGKFNSLQAKLTRAMKDRTDKTTITLDRQAAIAFDRFAHGANSRSRENPQYYKNAINSIGEANTRRLLVDLIDRHFKSAHVRGTNLNTRIKRLLPLTGLSYQQLNDRYIGYNERLRAAKKSGNQASIQEAQREINQFRGDLRKTISEHAVARALHGHLSMNSVLTEFWFNHFNLDAQKSFRHALDYEHQLSRRVCGTFLDLLTTSASHPAMLQYLDNFKSVKPGLNRPGFGTGINENYGRELLELYTFGIGPKTSAEPGSPYSQSDVTKTARLLTGWSFKATKGSKPKFVFNSFAHDTGRPKIMGQTFPAGVNGGKELLKFLARHNKTKQNVCKKLTVELAGEKAPSSLINACKQAWGTYGNLPAMYEAIVTSNYYWSWSNYKKSMKNPLELVASASRAMGYNIWRIESREDLKIMSQAAQKLGVLPRMVPPPTGYPVYDRVWANPNYMTEAINYAAKVGTTNLPYYNEVTGRNMYGLAAEREIARVASTNPSLAVTRVVRDQLKLHPQYFWTNHGRNQLNLSAQDPDYDKIDKISVPGRTINTLILGSREFLLK